MKYRREQLSARIKFDFFNIAFFADILLTQERKSIIINLYNSDNLYQSDVLLAERKNNADIKGI